MSRQWRVRGPPGHTLSRTSWLPTNSTLICRLSFCAYGAGSIASRVSCADNGRLLLANLLQSSSRTFSCVSFPSFFAFQKGIWDTQISALLSSPTVSLPFLRHILLSQHSPFGLYCRVWVIDYTRGQGYNVSVGMVSGERWYK
jgi:hypothetical protein